MHCTAQTDGSKRTVESMAEAKMLIVVALMVFGGVFISASHIYIYIYSRCVIGSETRGFVFAHIFNGYHKVYKAKEIDYELDAAHEMRQPVSGARQCHGISFDWTSRENEQQYCVVVVVAHKMKEIAVREQNDKEQYPLIAFLLFRILDYTQSILSRAQWMGEWCRTAIMAVNCAEKQNEWEFLRFLILMDGGSCWRFAWSI